VSAVVASEPPPAKEATPAAGAGMSKAASIEVCGVDGERTYLQNLRCGGDKAPTFERAGSVGPRSEVKTKEDEEAVMQQILSTKALKPGEKDFHTIDEYDVVCGGKTVKIYLDMYHCPEPKTRLAPPGFTVKGQKQ